MSRQPISILILDNSFTFGGAINSLCHLLRAMDKDKFVPILVTGQSPEYLSENFNCTWYHYIPKLPWINDHIYRKILSLPLFKVKQFRSVLNLLRSVYWIIFITLPESFKYYRLGRKHHVEIIHLNNILGSQLAGIIAAKLLRVPCIAHLRDFEVVHPLTRFYASLIDHHVAISRAISDNLMQLGVSESRISLVHDAIDLSEFDTEVDIGYLFEEFVEHAEKKRIGIFGRIVDWKGIREFIHAVYHVLQEIPDVTAFIVGNCSDGDQAFSSEMTKLTESLGVADRVVFTGYRQDVPALMKFMDIVVHGSIRPEPFGMVIIEAMAMGKPVVVTRGGGPLDIVDQGKTGFIVEMGNSDSIARAVMHLLQQQDLIAMMGLEGRRRVVNSFLIQVAARKIEQLYEILKYE